MSGICPSGHASIEADYCSVCGVVMGAPARAPVAQAASPARASAGNGPSLANCPSCGEPREAPDARFCEVCRYDFVARKPGPPPTGRASAPAPAPTPRPVSSPPPAAFPSPSNAVAPAGWELVVAVDPSLDLEPDAEHPCPTDTPERVVALSDAELLVGRHDDQRDIHPDIPLRDPGCSRRHAKFVRDADGAVALQDLASTNGSTLNGVEVKPGTRHRLKAGDAVTLGRWTRITLRERT